MPCSSGVETGQLEAVDGGGVSGVGEAQPISSVIARQRLSNL
ncbi:MAG: hypothetical protein WBD56_00065 [Anaerolineales bacterium]